MLTLAYNNAQWEHYLVAGDTIFLSSFDGFGNFHVTEEQLSFPSSAGCGSANCAHWLTTAKRGFSLWMKLSLDVLLTIPHCWGHFQENRKENAEKERLEMTKCFDHLDLVGEWLWLKIYIKSYQCSIFRQSFLIFCFELSLFWNLPTFWKMKENGSCQTTRERTLKPK